MKKLILSFAAGIQIIFSSCDRSVSPEFGRAISFDLSGQVAQGYFITAIAFDSKGAAWLGTLHQGLLRYDGSLTLFDSRNSILPDGLGVTDIAVDSRDNMWAASAAGLVKYDGEKFTVYDTAGTGMTRNYVSSVAVDSEDNVWYSSSVAGEGGLMKYDGSGWTRFTPENSKLAGNVVQDIEIDRKGDKWVAVQDGVNSCSIVRISGDDWSVFDRSDFGFSAYYWGKLACGPAGIHASIDYKFSSIFDTSRPALLVFDGKKWAVQTPLNAAGNPVGYIGIISFDRRGYLWVSKTGSSGLSVFDGKSWTYAEPAYLESKGVFDIAADRNNSIWIGTGDGVYFVRQY